MNEWNKMKWMTDWLTVNLLPITSLKMILFFFVFCIFGCAFNAFWWTWTFLIISKLVYGDIWWLDDRPYTMTMMMMIKTESFFTQQLETTHTQKGKRRVTSWQILSSVNILYLSSFCNMYNLFSLLSFSLYYSETVIASIKGECVQDGRMERIDIHNELYQIMK